MPRNSHCFECVCTRVRACVYMWLSLCLQSFCLGRQEEEHRAPKTPEQAGSVCTYSTYFLLPKNSIIKLRAFIHRLPDASDASPGG